MAKKHYMTADQIVEAWTYHKNGVHGFLIAKTLGVSSTQVSHYLRQIANSLAGGHNMRRVNKHAYNRALHRIKTEGTRVLPTPEDFTPIHAAQQELLETKPLVEREVCVLLTTPKMHEHVMLGYLQKAKKILAKRIVFTDNDGKTLITIEV